MLAGPPTEKPMSTKPKRPARAAAAADAADRRILAAAAKLYAEHGFDVAPARIARAARVTPAALARRYPDAAALRKGVFAWRFGARWKPAWSALLVDRGIPLERRLVQFFTEYRGNIDRVGARLWTRAGLLGMHRAQDFSATLAERILHPVARELRREAGVEARAPRRVSGREEELVQVVHAAIAFPHTRSHIFDMRVHGTLPQLVAMMVRVWLPGAKAEMRRLHPRVRRG